MADYRRSLLGELPDSHLAGYAASAAALSDMTAQLVGTVRERLPGPEVTPAQLRDRSWWSGPELFLLVDDYDLIAGQSSNPLLPLAELLPQARDVGLHVVLVRRCAGAGRSMFDPLLTKLRESASPAMVMSGDRDEGVLLGNVKPSAQPAGRGRLVSRRRGTQLGAAGLAAAGRGLSGSTGTDGTVRGEVVTRAVRVPWQVMSVLT